MRSCVGRTEQHVCRRWEGQNSLQPLREVSLNRQPASQADRLGCVLRVLQTSYPVPPDLHVCQVRNCDVDRLLQGGSEVLWKRAPQGHVAYRKMDT